MFLAWMSSLLRRRIRRKVLRKAILLECLMIGVIFINVLLVYLLFSVGSFQFIVMEIKSYGEY